MSDARTSLAAELGTIARRAIATIREERVVYAAAGSLDAAAFFAGIPALLEILTRLLFGTQLFGPGWLIAATILAPVLWITARSARYVVETIDDATALAEVDRALHLEDRLIAAREFLGLDDRSAFMEAAIEDARAHTAVALERGLPRSPLPRVGRTPLLRALGAVLFVVAALQIDLPPGGPAGGSETPAIAGGPRLAEHAAERDEAPERPPVEVPTPPERPVRPEDRQTSTSEPGGERSGELSEDVKKTLGKTTAGKSSAAASASGTSQSKGTPSNQSQVSEKQTERSKRAPKKPKEAKPGEEAEANPQKPEEMSGATAGRGAASGSSKSPSASKWSSKDQVVSDDEEDLEEDEEVDDEFDNSDARGGMQPQLRDRKPPVNRDLTIGFGNGKNPDANGRGGPSEQKKSRGVASLVLGVPIPDHVKGRPNPGKTKITQERVEPQEEEAPAVAATPRAPRQDAIGRVARPDLLPWMRDLIQDYYRTIRARGVNQE